MNQGSGLLYRLGSHALIVTTKGNGNSIETELTSSTTRDYCRYITSLLPTY